MSGFRRRWCRKGGRIFGGFGTQAAGICMGFKGLDEAVAICWFLKCQLVARLLGVFCFFLHFWCLVFGFWCLVVGVCLLAFVFWFLVVVVFWFLVSGSWFLVFGF